ncbi:hypothetical protein ABGB12_06000 [Actinocorallia sp. B10E7]|uniref:hypothetical protein n=1 Tax=Actinocorallia sp. B10E7 TaxID=3153558 RepID=UPI00325CCFE6
MKSIVLLSVCLSLVLISSGTLAGLPYWIEGSVLFAFLLLFVGRLGHGLGKAVNRTLDRRFAIRSAASLLVAVAVYMVADQGVPFDLRVFLSKDALERAAGSEAAVAPDCMDVDLEKAPVVKAGLFEVRCVERGDGVTNLYVLADGDLPSVWSFSRIDPGGKPGLDGYWFDDHWTFSGRTSGAGSLLPSDHLRAESATPRNQPRARAR